MSVKVFIEIFLGEFVIVNAANIEPVVFDFVFGDGLVLAEEFDDELIHAVGLVFRDVGENAGFHDVDAGEGVGDDVGFFLDAGDSIAIEEDVPEGIGHDDFFDGKGEEGVLGIGEAEDFAEIDIGENVAVHHDEGFIEVLLQEFDGTGGAEAFLLLADGEFDSVTGAIAEKVFDVFGFVVGGEKYLSDPVLAEVLDLDLKHRLFSDGEEGFWDDFGEGLEACAEAAC